MIGGNYNNGRGLAQSIDWMLIAFYLVFVIIGWMNIYASVYDPEVSALSFSLRSGKQFVWILTAFGLAALILFVIPPRLYEAAAPPMYAVILLLLIVVRFVGGDIKGSYSWFSMGPVSFQPAELSKTTTALMLALYMSKYGYKISQKKDFLTTMAILGLPMLAILMENETGSMLVYVGFIFMLYREGLSGWFVFLLCMVIVTFIMTLTASPYAAIITLAVVITFCNELFSDNIKRWLSIYLPIFIVLIAYPYIYNVFTEIYPSSVFVHFKPVIVLIPFIITLVLTYVIKGFRQMNNFKLLSIAAFVAGIIMTFSVQFFFNNVLHDYQRKRIEVVLGMTEDPNGVGYNVRQSMIAIGSGGLIGKGYLHGTQTTFGFVPEQSTDFIFCTIGEEWGFLGSAAVIILYVLLIIRIIRDSEESRSSFTRIYGYCVASTFFMHLIINIGMTLGLMPVIGIPLPMISYGGSSLWSFTIMLFIFIALYSNERRYF